MNLTRSQCWHEGDQDLNKGGTMPPPRGGRGGRRGAAGGEQQEGLTASGP